MLVGEKFSKDEAAELLKQVNKRKRSATRRRRQQNRGSPPPAQDGLRWIRGGEVHASKLVGRPETLYVSCGVSKDDSGGLAITTTMTNRTLDVALNPRLFSLAIRGTSHKDATVTFDTAWDFTSIHSVICFATAKDRTPCFTGTWKTEHSSMDPFPLHTYIAAGMNCKYHSQTEADYTDTFMCCEGERITLLAKVYVTCFAQNSIMAARLEDAAPLDAVEIDFVLDKTILLPRPTCIERCE